LPNFQCGQCHTGHESNTYTPFHTCTYSTRRLLSPPVCLWCQLPLPSWLVRAGAGPSGNPADANRSWSWGMTWNNGGTRWVTLAAVARVTPSCLCLELSATLSTDPSAVHVTLAARSKAASYRRSLHRRVRTHKKTYQANTCLLFTRALIRMQINICNYILVLSLLLRWQD
jgi:hypothetical protein